MAHALHSAKAVKKTVLALAVLALGASACNSGELAAAAGPTPTPDPIDSPIAVIAGAQSYGPLDSALFDGLGSYDPGGGAITGYAWSIVAAPPGSQSQVVTMGDDAHVSFFIDLAGDYSIELTVTSETGLTGSATYDYSAVPGQDLHVELLWPGEYTEVDMDLHLVWKSGGGTLWNGTKDCNYTNCAGFGAGLDWGVTGDPTDDPTLDIDNIIESVPENINIDKPANGTYAACVHYYSSHVAGDIPVNNEVRVYLLGAPVFDATKTLGATDQVWYVGDITCNNGQCTVTANGAVTTTFPGFPAAGPCG